MDIYSEFTRLYQLQKTLRFELKPVPRKGETQKEALNRLKSSAFFANDTRRESCYTDVKNIIDDFFRSFIESSLKSLKIDWSPLAEALNRKDEKSQKEISDKIRKVVVDAFGSTKDFFGKDLFEKFIPAWLENEVANQKITAGEKTQKLEKLSEFKGFTTYFSGFWENRKNIFTDKEQHTAIAFRIVNENFPRFYENAKAFANAPQEIQDKFIGKLPISLDLFNEALTQNGIDAYNTHIGGERNARSGEEKGRGFNEEVNQWNQTHPGKKVSKMKPLYKQILSDKEETWSGRLILCNQDLAVRLKELHERLFVQKNDKGETATESAMQLISELPNFDSDKIWISGKHIPAISQALFGQWDALNSELKISTDESDSNTRNEKLFSLKAIEVAIPNVRKNYEHAENGQTLDSLSEFFGKVKLTNNTGRLGFVTFTEATDKTRQELENAIRISEQKNELLGNDVLIEKIKSALDSVIAIFHKVKMLTVRENKLRTKDVDSAFYAELEDVFSPFALCASTYDSVRNYLTKKPYSTEKMKLCFDSPTLANGWDENKIPDNRAFILRKSGKYFLGLLNAQSSAKVRKSVLECEASADCEEDCYERMVYKYLPSPVKMLPKLFFSKKGIEAHNPPAELIDKATRNNDPTSLIRFYQKAILQYNNGDYRAFNFKFKRPEEYASTNDFFHDVEQQNYHINFKKIPVRKIKEFVENNTLFLFEIYNKDFSEKSTGRKNLHTLFWLSAFSPENKAENFTVKLNGEAEIFWREASLSGDTGIHKPGSILVNRRDSDGKPIPEGTYLEIYHYKNGKIPENELSPKASELIRSGKIVCKKASYETRKDRRYTEDKLFFHVPLTLNRNLRHGKDISPKMLNEQIRELICSENVPVKIIGIDRGERNLISLVLIDGKGKILLQKSFNAIEESSQNTTRETNYHELLKIREDERQEARKSWKTIGKIAELKEGYISQVVHAISKLIVEHNAIVVLEDLNIGFKQGRFAVERQIYQKFERALIEKLNFLVFKEREADKPAGVLNALQLTNKFESFEKLGTQSGILFYVPAGYTSKIDPTTGFVNIFDLSSLTNTKAKKEFFSKFSRISYSQGDDAFTFEFDYSKFKTFKQPIAKKQWVIYTIGERLAWNPKVRKPDPEFPTKMLKEAFTFAQIDWNTSNNLVESIANTSEEGRFRQDFWDKLFRAFKYTLQMRNSHPNATGTDDDYLISPVKAADGKCFDSRNEAKEKHPTLPTDADANGAYHIALKGLMGIRRKFAVSWQKNESWFKFVQEREFEH